MQPKKGHDLTAELAGGVIVEIVIDSGNAGSTTWK